MLAHNSPSPCGRGLGERYGEPPPPPPNLLPQGEGELCPANLGTPHDRNTMTSASQIQAFSTNIRWKQDLAASVQEVTAIILRYLLRPVVQAGSRVHRQCSATCPA
jgi:hypothetical protein